MNLLKRENELWEKLNYLGLKPGISLFLQNIKVTKTQKIGMFNLACKWKREINGVGISYIHFSFHVAPSAPGELIELPSVGSGTLR